nr:zinc-binding dehydrogenase [Antrihabitans stalactiti]
MLFTRAQLTAGQTVLVQGASGGLATALIMLAKNAGVRVWVTGRTAESRAFATTLGADDVFPVGTRLPELVDAVMDSVGAVTWQHSLKCLKPGGIMVVSGGTSGYDVNINIAVVFARQLRIEGSSMGTVDELQALATLCATEKISPPIEAILPLSEGRGGFAAMHDGTARGKIVFVP